MSYLQNKNVFEYPKYHTIHNEVCEQIKNGVPVINEKSIKAYMLPISFHIKKFFELPGVLQTTLFNIDQLKKRKDYSNFLNCELYKEKVKQIGCKTIIPYF